MTPRSGRCSSCSTSSTATRRSSMRSETRCSPRRFPSSARPAGSPGCAVRCSRRRRSRPARTPSGSPRSAARAGPTAATGSRSTRRSSCCAKPASPSSPAGRSPTRMRRSPPGASSAARSRSSAPGCATSPSTAALILDVDDEIAVKQAYRRLGGTVLVERMAAPGTELLVAVRRDGVVPVLVVGARRRPHRAARHGRDRPAARHATRGSTTRCETLGRRSPPTPIATLAIKLAELPLALIELNPVIVHAHSAVAVDALADQEVLTP